MSLFRDLQLCPHRKFVYCLILVLVFTLAVPVTADGNLNTDDLPPHPDVGIVDINTGLEAAHQPPYGGYKFFDANYQQAMNLGSGWHRWKVDWHAVEQQPAGSPARRTVAETARVHRVNDGETI